MSDETMKASCLNWTIGKFHARIERVPRKCSQR
ncbi:hypothetical protein AZE42_11970 [Rhizopogon vesiculosus]|uniref:Uncharacterized protein n=1 Tax=Rhizopogon vesiculosus TaxID=180088 RepID=A0A1J8Q1Q8_9AGAM|nr:hypothetical protein AZE42_11970 [Rhizopogon vesiculosus]